LSSARLTWLTWLALMGLIPGTSLWAFNPFDGVRDRPELMKENKAMNTSMDTTAPVAETRPKDGLIPSKSKIETATFAMG
jgi:hypothetical protein